MHGENLK